MTELETTYFKSKVIGRLSSDSLLDIKKSILNLERDKKRLKDTIDDIERKSKSLSTSKNKINWFPIKLFLKKRISEIDSELKSNEEELVSLREKLSKSKFALEVNITDKQDSVFGALHDAFIELRGSEKIWDITKSQRVDRVAQRTVADNAINRERVALSLSGHQSILCDYKAMKLQNANGDDVCIYPQFFFIEGKTDFALIDLSQVEVDFAISNFLETESVPRDSEVIDQTWFKANKDGSRDKRFADNYQIPIVQYGVLHFSSKSGLNEVYMVSNPKVARDFKTVFDDYVRALSRD